MEDKTSLYRRRAASLYPDLAPYIATAKFGGGLRWDAERQMCVPDDGVLMFEVGATTNGDGHETK